MGIISPVGLDVPTAWVSLVDGRSGIGRITRFDASGDQWRVKIAGEAWGFDPANYMNSKDARRVDRTTQLALAAADEAVKQACLTTLADRDDIGVMVGCGSGGIETYADAYRTLLEKGPTRMNPFLIPAEVVDSSGVAIGIRYGFHGPNFAVTSACATLPSGPGMRIFSFAPNAAFTKSRSFAASLTVRYGVTVWYPSGIALTISASFQIPPASS